MEFLFTTEKTWIDRWDAFLQQSERGIYIQLSDWIKSYDAYGFDSNFFIATENDTIIGGCAIVIARFSFLKFFIVSCGPILSEGYEQYADVMLKKLKDQAQKQNCCYFQISMPVCKDEVNPLNYCLDTISSNSFYNTGQEGVAFKYVIPLHGMRITYLNNRVYDEVFAAYNSNTKRNIKKTNQNGFEFRFVTSDEEIKAAYDCFVLNAQDKGYPLRSYESMAKSLRSYIDKDFCKIACCYYEGKLIAALYVILCGQRLTYINGGVLKEYQHLNASAYLHDKMIQYSMEKGYKSYDLSVGGSKGVVRFKEGFGSKLYLYQNTRYWVLKPKVFRVYLFLEKYLKRNKNKVAKFLTFIKRGRF